jgi:hypothetical protein
VNATRGYHAAALAITLVLLAGCGASTPGHAPAGLDTEVLTRGPATPIVVGAADSVGSAPGSPGALYGYRFKQTEPGSDRFTFYDRDVSFYFRPAPDALHFQLENKQDRTIYIDWDRTRITSPDGTSGRTAHSGTEFRARYGSQAQTAIRGLQRYSDYVLPMDYLLDPGGASVEQVSRPLFPEDKSAPNYNGREFGVDLAMIIDNQPRTYSFRFKVVSVLPR